MLLKELIDVSACQASMLILRHAHMHAYRVCMSCLSDMPSAAWHAQGQKEIRNQPILQKCIGANVLQALCHLDTSQLANEVIYRPHLSSLHFFLLAFLPNCMIHYEWVLWMNHSAFMPNDPLPRQDLCQDNIAAYAEFLEILEFCFGWNYFVFASLWNIFEFSWKERESNYDVASNQHTQDEISPNLLPRWFQDGFALGSSWSFCTGKWGGLEEAGRRLVGVRQAEKEKIYFSAQLPFHTLLDLSNIV